MYICIDNDIFVTVHMIIEIRLGCQKWIIYRQDPVPQGHEVTSFQNPMVNTHLGRRLEGFLPLEPRILG